MRWSSRFGVVAVGVALAGQALAVDGVIEINQTRALAGGVTAGDTPGWPVTIDAPGSYRLTGNLNGTGSMAAIEITASSVSLDLNGFEIRNFFQYGITAAASIGRVSVSNGRLVDFIFEGISLPGYGNTVDHIVVDAFQGYAAVILGASCLLTNSILGGTVGESYVGSGCVVRNVISSGTDSTGLTGGSSVTVTDSEFSYNDGEGLVLGDDASVTNVTASNNTLLGITVGANSTVVNSRASANGCGIQVVSGAIIGNAASGNGTGICVTGAGTVISNTALGNSGVGLDASSGTGYASNSFNGNNGGDANPQVSGGLETGGNVCGGDTTCP